MSERERTRNTHVVNVANSKLDFRRDRYILLEIYGENIGMRRDIEKDLIVIGRSASCDIVLEDQSVSRRHLTIRKERETISVDDLNSTNGTFVNERKVGSSEMLANGDRIKLGNTIFKFIWSDDMEAEYYDTLYQYTIRDGLTGLHNRKFMKDFLQKEFIRARTSDGRISLLMLDIDHFKNVNDTFGHITGDLILTNVSKKLMEYTGERDCVARFGGEEFVIILPMIPKSEAHLIAERIRLAVMNSPLLIGGGEIPVSISIGVASNDDDIHDSASLLKMADERLYTAKNKGRNRVES